MKSVPSSFAATVALALATGACGARTGLIDPDVVVLPDASLDVVVRDVVMPDVRVICTPGTYTLTARSADAIFVIDRSGSMAFGFNAANPRAPGRPSRWETLRTALTNTFSAYTATTDIGAIFYPQSGTGGATSCALANVPDLDVDPASGSFSAVLGLLGDRSFQPSGGTPTYAGLLRAYTWCVRHPSRTRSRFLVLATDGGPNCNSALDPRTCVCTEASTGPGGVSACNTRPGGADQCLDTERTADLLGEIATNPATAIPTYVIGLAPDADPTLTPALTAMAIAGGRPLILADGTPTFYPVRAASDLETVLQQIQGSIARCTYVTPSRPDTLDDIALVLGGTTLHRDVTHTDGWDWTDPSVGVVTLFGATCARATSDTLTLTATVGCGDAGTVR